MADIKKLMGELNGLDSEEALDRVAKMVKSGEAGVTPQQAINLANKFMPMLDKAQQEKIRKLIKKIKS